MRPRLIATGFFLASLAALGLAHAISIAPFAATGASVIAKGENPAPKSTHPLDPLSDKEMKLAVEVLRKSRKLDDKALFPMIALHEPTRAESVAPEKLLGRKALVIALDRQANATFEAIIDLNLQKILSWNKVPNVQPAVLIEEYDSADEIVRADPGWQAAMKKRKFDPKHVQLDAWAAGYVEGHAGARLLRVLSYHRGKATNAYARPIEGVVALVNMNSKKVIELTDKPAPTPEDASDFFDEKIAGAGPKGLNPLQIHQPKGPSFTVNGHEVRWQNWIFRYCFHPREGLVLHTVGWMDGKTLRPILHRASICEMVVPYGHPDGTWNWRNAFDMGEYGLGQSSISLRAGQEVPPHATLLSATIANDKGEPETKKNVVALFEQDGGMLWTHSDYKTQDKIVTRRSHQLVLQNIFTIGNYDYGIRWVFHQDGVLEVQAELTGVLLAKGVGAQECEVCKQGPDKQGKLVADGEERFGKLVAKNVLAPVHQHFFCFRLDMSVDGPKNSVYEIDVRPEADTPPNTLQNAFMIEYQLLRSEREGRRNLNFAAHRAWKVINPNKKTALGHFPAYKLEPGVNAVPYPHPESRVRQRARFLDHHLWVTRSRSDELYPAGKYPNQNPGGDGLPQWVNKNESIVNEEVVLWYTLGVTHVPRVEEWPVMPVSRVGFRLLPDGFFERNPTLANGN